MPRPIREQLLQAWEASGLTLAQLIQLCEFDMTEVSLGRKLRSRQIMTTEEAEAIARVLRVKITAGREARAS